jgi:simple sugar transport system permease protein
VKIALPSRASLAEPAASVAVAILALLIGLVVVTAAGYPAGATVRALWDGAFVGSQSLDGTLETMVPLVLSALGWIVAFRAGRINVGLEGQILTGGIAATASGLYLGGVSGAIGVPLAIAAGVAGGAVWAAIAAVLWAYRNVNEIIATFMLNLIAVLMVTWLVTGPLQEETHSTPVSQTLPGSVAIAHVPGEPSLSWDILAIPVAVVLLVVVLRRTTAGFRLRLTGANPEAARHVGVPVVKVGALALVVSGAIAGLAGACMILGPQGGVLQDDFSSNLGFDGIAVALLARNSPIGSVPAAVLFAALIQGGGFVEAQVGVSTSLVDTVFGIVVVLAAGAGWLLEGRYRLPVFRRRVGVE